MFMIPLNISIFFFSPSIFFFRILISLNFLLPIKVFDFFLQKFTPRFNGRFLISMQCGMLTLWRQILQQALSLFLLQAGGSRNALIPFIGLDNVYVLCDGRRKHVLWNLLSNFILHRSNSNWCVCCDFNSYVEMGFGKNKWRLFEVDGWVSMF